MGSVDVTIKTLTERIGQIKQQEVEVYDSINREVKEAYSSFMEIRQLFIDGLLDDVETKEKAEQQLVRCLKIMKSHGHRIKAREIERFIHATGIFVSSDSSAKTELFYKKAFMTILPIHHRIGVVVVSAGF